MKLRRRWRWSRCRDRDEEEVNVGGSEDGGSVGARTVAAEAGGRCGGASSCVSPSLTRSLGKEPPGPLRAGRATPRKVRGSGRPLPGDGFPNARALLHGDKIRAGAWPREKAGKPPWIGSSKGGLRGHLGELLEAPALPNCELFMVLFIRVVFLSSIQMN